MGCKGFVLSGNAAFVMTEARLFGLVEYTFTSRHEQIQPYDRLHCIQRVFANHSVFYGKSF